MNKKILSSFILLSSIASLPSSYAMNQVPRGTQPGIYRNSSVRLALEHNNMNNHFNMLNYLLCKMISNKMPREHIEPLVRISLQQGALVPTLIFTNSDYLGSIYGNNVKEVYSDLIYYSDLKLGQILERIRVDFENFERIIGLSEYTKPILNELHKNISREIREEFRNELIFELGYEDDKEVIRQRLEENGFTLLNDIE